MTDTTAIRAHFFPRLGKPDKGVAVNLEGRKIASLAAQLTMAKVGDIISRAEYIDLTLETGNQRDIIQRAIKLFRNKSKTPQYDVTRTTGYVFTTECFVQVTTSNRIAVILLIERVE